MNNEQVPNFLIKRALLTPDRPALKFQGFEYTFKELYDFSYRMAGKLQAQGLEKDHYVGVLLKNHVDTIVILLSLQLLGIKAVILNNRLTAKEISWQLKDSNSMLLITEEKFNEASQELQLSIPIVTKENLTDASIVDPILQEEIELSDVCSVMYTSGTTGNPKGVIQTYGNHWWSAIGSSLNLGLREGDCWLCSVPLFHISGYSILMRSIIYGMKIVLHESFDEQITVEDMSKEKVTIMSVVATTLSRILDYIREDTLPSSVRCMLLGGGPAPLPLLEKCVEKKIPVYQTYGMTETSSQIVTLSPEYSILKLGSAGKPLFPSQLKIVTEAGKEAQPLQSGEIVVKGPNVTKGYLNRKKETEASIQNGWLTTGDIGYLDEEGFLFVQDRRSDLIISGGENIYPAEIEGVLASHPSLSDVGVIGKKDVKWGEVPVAFIVRQGDVTEEEIYSFCTEKLAKYKVPRTFYYVEELPRNASKKLLRRQLREWFADLENKKG